MKGSARSAASKTPALDRTVIVHIYIVSSTSPSYRPPTQIISELLSHGRINNRHFCSFLELMDNRAHCIPQLQWLLYLRQWRLFPLFLINCNNSKYIIYENSIRIIPHTSHARPFGNCIRRVYCFRTLDQTKFNDFIFTFHGSYIIIHKRHFVGQVIIEN